MLQSTSLIGITSSLTFTSNIAIAWLIEAVTKDESQGPMVSCKEYQHSLVTVVTSVCVGVLEHVVSQTSYRSHTRRYSMRLSYKYLWHMMADIDYGALSDPGH